MHWIWHLVFRYGRNKKSKLISVATRIKTICNQVSKILHDLATISQYMTICKLIKKMKTFLPSEFGELIVLN